MMSLKKRIARSCGNQKLTSIRPKDGGIFPEENKPNMTFKPSELQPASVMSRLVSDKSMILRKMRHERKNLIEARDDIKFRMEKINKEFNICKENLNTHIITIIITLITIN